MKITKYTTEVFENPYSFIRCWDTLGLMSRVTPKVLSYLCRDDVKGQYQRRIRIKNRTVYESTGALKFVQDRLLVLLNGLYDHLDDDISHILAYRKGLNPREFVRQNCCGWQVEMTFDIRKYFDNITQWHIIEALQYCGLTKPGAKLISRYCTVDTPGGRNTLQQGSSVSGLLSNLVGHLFFDKPIKEWIAAEAPKYEGLKTMYVRYCDNMAVFCDMEDGSQVPQEFLDALKEQCKHVVGKYNFRTHKWATVRSNHPKRNQKLLGIVLNKEARIEKDVYKRLRAHLFNVATKPLDSQVQRWSENNPTVEKTKTNYYLSLEDLQGSMQSYLRGKISYIGSINEKHKLELSKLFEASKLIHAHKDGLFTSGMLQGPVFESVKRYTDQSEAQEEFIARLEEVVSGVMQGTAAQ